MTFKIPEWITDMQNRKQSPDDVIGDNGYSTEIETALASIRQGTDARAFFDSSIGRYLLQKATEIEVTAFRAFCDADPEDAKAIRKIQEDQRVPKLVFAWLEDAINAGLEAGQIIEAVKEMENG